MSNDLQNPRMLLLYAITMTSRFKPELLKHATDDELQELWDRVLWVRGNVRTELEHRRIERERKLRGHAS